MQGKLIIHIGPPKSATTSLQYLWMELKNPGFKYLGVFQPRENKSFGSTLYNYVNSKHKNIEYENELLKELEVLLLKYKYVVISEEMFLLEGPISFEEKLKKLFRLVSVFRPILTFCVRDAASVYFSFFVETYTELPRKLQSSFAKFQESSYCDCYKYTRLYNKLLYIGFNRINFFFFDDLVAGSLTMEEILGIEDLDYSFKVEIGKKNVTSKKNKDLKVRKRGVLENFVFQASQFVPSTIKGYGLGSKVLDILRSDKCLELKAEPITENTNKEFVGDLLFLRSLKLHKGEFNP